MHWISYKSLDFLQCKRQVDGECLHRHFRGRWIPLSVRARQLGKSPRYASGTSCNRLERMSGSTTSARPTPIDSGLLTNYADSFYGFGNLEATIWFVGIEEAGGWRQRDIDRRLHTWDRNGRAELENAPTFYPESGNGRWHGPTAALQPTWAQLIGMLFVARGAPTTNEAILDYQRQHLGSRNGEICLVELLPLPSPGQRL